MKTIKLSKRAMLIHLSGHQWTGRKKDKRVSKDVCVRVNADADAGAWWTYLVPQKELKPINTAWGRVYRLFCDLTLPWLDGGLRILPSDMYFTFREKMKTPIADYNKAVESFLKRWPEIVIKAPKRLGKLATNLQLPNVAELRAKFYINQDILPVPEVSDFRIDNDEASKQVESSIKSGMVKATRELYERLDKLVGNIAEVMSKPDKKFRNSIIRNLKDFCVTIPKYNVMNIPELETLSHDIMKKLTNLDPEDLREIPRNRKKAGAEAKALLVKIRSYKK